MSKEAGKLANLGNVEGLSPQVLHQIKLVAKAIGEVETTVENHHTRHELDGEDEVSIDWTQLVNVPPPEAHTHDAGDVVSGIFDLARIPDLDASKITSGIFDLARIPNIDWGRISANFPRTIAELLSDHDLAHHPLAIIPTMDDAHIPDLETLSYGGAFATAQIPNLDASKITSGVFDLARIPTPLKSKVLSENFTAGAAISAGEVVAITGDNEVSPADNTLRSQTIGVALNDAAVGEQVEVVIYGKTTVVADGVISAGDPLAAAATAGRVVSLLSHSHTNPDTSSVNLAHTHGVGTLSIGAVGNHRHDCPTTGSAGSHTHSNPSTSSVNLAHTHSFTPSGSIGTTSISHRHNFTPGGTISTESAGTPSGSIGIPSATKIMVNITDVTALYAADTSGGSPTHSFTAISGYTTYAVPAKTHTHTFTGDALPTHRHYFVGISQLTDFADPSHNHSFTGTSGTTGSALGSHSHTQGDTGAAGSHTHSVGYTTYAGGHGHSISGSTGSALGTHSHTVGDTSSVGTAQILGKALENAVAGGSLSILVCLAG